MVVAISALSNYYLQSKQMEEQLINHAQDVALLWSTTIHPENIEAVLSTQNEKDPNFLNLKQSLSIFNQDNSIYLNSFIVDGKEVDPNKVFIITSALNHNKNEWLSLSSYKANKEFMDAYKDAIHSEKPSHSKVYHDKNGTWITAFSPIKNNDGEIVALLGIDINAMAIQSLQKQYAVILLVMFLIITPCVFFVLRKGLIKVLEPVNELIYGVNEVSNGNFDINLKVLDSSNLGLLCERFNLMAKQLTILFEKLTVTSEQFNPEPRSIILHNFEEALFEMENIVEKSKLYRELQRAEKMNAIGQLAASVAHEIRNPMTVVKGFLQIFLAKEQMSEEERMYIRLMIDEMNRAETIINDYLSLAKPDLQQTESIAGK